MNDNLIKYLKAHINHHSPVHMCKGCKHFVPTDCSGSFNARPQHCTLGSAMGILELPTEEDACCDLWKPK